MQRNWKTTYIIYSEVGIEEGVYKYKDCTIKINLLDSLINGDVFVYTGNRTKFRLLNIFLELKSQEIEEVYFYTERIVNEFLSRISLIGYCAADIVKHIITTIDLCELNENFYVLSSEIIHSRNYRIDINSEYFEKVYNSTESDEYIEVAIGFLRKALTTKSIEEKILNLYATLERIADGECKEFKSTTCKNCNNVEVSQLKLTKKYIKGLLREKGVNAKDINNFTDRDRNKIAHGLGKRDYEFYSSLKETVLKIQSSIIEIVKERMKADLVNSTTTVVDKPFIIYRFIAINENEYRLDNKDQKSVMMKSIVGISKVESADERAKGNGEFMFGISYGQDNLYLNSNSFQREFFPKVLNGNKSNPYYNLIFVSKANENNNKYPLRLFIE